MRTDKHILFMLTIGALCLSFLLTPSAAYPEAGKWSDWLELDDKEQHGIEFSWKALGGSDQRIEWRWKNKYASGVTMEYRIKFSTSAGSQVLNNFVVLQPGINKSPAFSAMGIGIESVQVGIVQVVASGLRPGEVLVDEEEQAEQERVRENNRRRRAAEAERLAEQQRQMIAAQQAKQEEEEQRQAKIRQDRQEEHEAWQQAAQNISQYVDPIDQSIRNNQQKIADAYASKRQTENRTSRQTSQTSPSSTYTPQYSGGYTAPSAQGGSTGKTNYASNQQTAAVKTAPKAECHSMTSAVKAEITHPIGPGHCDGAMEAFMTNTSSQRITCEVVGVKGGVFQYNTLSHTDIGPGERLNGEWSGMWWCGYGQNDTYKYSCVLANDDHSCRVDLVKRSH